MYVILRKTVIRKNVKFWMVHLRDVGSITGLAVGLVWWDLRVFAFMFVSVFVNSIICDIRDIEGDGLHGVRTIPVMLGVERTKLALVIITSAMWFLLPVSVKSMVAILASYALIVLPFR
jgi:4-hydroxybenzoate polyprenyltransferase